ncbi:MAG: ABC transporter ATP-binding protein [Cyclobacteriaceae bacterium]|nr:ABC transporter ATP-binding protein [Cyclobacteriaceae bacterium]
MLSIKNLKKEYGTHVILDIPQLQFESGLFWLKGNNGSGKSTLLKIISGIIPFDGEVNIDAVDLRKHPTDYRRLVNYVEAEPLYPPFLTGQDLVSFFISTRMANKEEVDELVQKFNIHSFIKNPIGTYSSGMVKKLSLVLAFIGRPKYILLDEPLVTIDKESVPILYELVKLYFGRGVNFVFTSHQAFELEGIVVKEMEVKDHKVWEL